MNWRFAKPRPSTGHSRALAASSARPALKYLTCAARCLANVSTSFLEKLLQPDEDINHSSIKRRIFVEYSESVAGIAAAAGRTASSLRKQRPHQPIAALDAACAVKSSWVDMAWQRCSHVTGHNSE